jgi:prevent-host-death family protein
VEEMAISKFKATCLAVLERVRKTCRPIRVTKFGHPVAEVVPPAPKARKKHWIGSMAGTVRIEGDLNIAS